MGQDRAGARGFYTLASAFFAQHEPQAQLVNDASHRTMASIFEYLRGRTEVAGTIHLITHAFADGRLQFPLDSADTDNVVSYAELRDAVRDRPEMFQLSGQVDAATTIRVRGCNMGRSGRMVESLDRAFTGLGRVIGLTHAETFAENRRTGQTWNYSSGYFVEYPGDVRQPQATLETDFRAKYTGYPEAFWRPFFRLVRRERDNQRFGILAVPVTVAAKHRMARRALPDLSYQITDVTDTFFADFDQSRLEFVESGTHWFLFMYTRRGDRNDVQFRSVELRIPTEEAAVTAGRDQSGRPEAYEWHVRRPTMQGHRVLTAEARRTEYGIRSTRVPIAHPTPTGMTSILPLDNPRYATTSTYEPPAEERARLGVPVAGP